jgi:hypothetical protein
MTAKSRYDGKPLLKLLESYVLWSIGELSEAEQKSLAAMTPKLQSIYGTVGSWQEIVASMMRMPADMPASIQRMWARNTEIARKSRFTLTPQKFAQMFVDENLAG